MNLPHHDRPCDRSVLTNIIGLQSTCAAGIDCDQNGCDGTIDPSTDVASCHGSFPGCPCTAVAVCFNSELGRALLIPCSMGFVVAESWCCLSLTPCTADYMRRRPGLHRRRVQRRARLQRGLCLHRQLPGLSLYSAGIDRASPPRHSGVHRRPVSDRQLQSRRPVLEGFQLRGPEYGCGYEHDVLRQRSDSQLRC